MSSSTVTTALGEVRGVEEQGVRTFRGVRYGRAQRWRAPELVSVQGVVDATLPGPAAPQPVGGPELLPGLGPRGAQSEDCQVLDVWSPVAANDLPVLVWIHGGSFLTGTIDAPTYDGARLAAGGAVVVAVQYRLGPLGFVDLRAHGGAELGLVANAGLHDVLVALDWVQEHIVAFGGDPSRVTVFGESAGGGVILHLLDAPQRARRFRRAIVQSGSTGRTFGPEAASAIAARVLALSDVADARAALALPVERLVAASVAAQSDADTFALAGLMPFHPCVDDELIRTPPADGLRAGVGRDCDLVLGVTRDEMNLFVLDAALEPERLHKRVERYLGVDRARAVAVCDAYADVLLADGRRSELVDVWGAIYSDREMLLPARDALDAHAAGPATTFGYRFDWDAPPRPWGAPLGAAHGIDIPFAFGRFDAAWLEVLGASSAADVEPVSAAMRSAWVAFAANGDPSNAVTGSWPAWDGGRTALVFDRVTRVERDPLGARAQGRLR